MFSVLASMIGVVFGSLELFVTIGRIGADWAAGARRALFPKNERV
jgi:hypothetical protein